MSIASAGFVRERDIARIAAVCRQQHVRRLALFGSVLRPDFGPDSDIDVLVEFLPGQTPGLGFFTLQAELSEILGRCVDLNTPLDLPATFRDHVVRTATPLYELA